MDGRTTGRLRVGVVYGGRSGEHEVSLRSAATVIGALDPARYEVVPIAITKDGRWLTGRDSLRLLEEAQRDARAGRRARRRGDPAADARRAACWCRQPAVQRRSASTSSSPSCTAPTARTARSRACSTSPTFPTSAPGCSPRASAWTRRSMKAVFRDAGIPVCRSIVARPGYEQPGDVVRARRRRARLSVLREAVQPGLVGRHLQGEDAREPRRRARRGLGVRSEDDHRGGDRRPGARVRRARQRARRGVRRRRADAVARVLRLRRQVRRRPARVSSFPPSSRPRRPTPCARFAVRRVPRHRLLGPGARRLLPRARHRPAAA